MKTSKDTMVISEPCGCTVGVGSGRLDYCRTHKAAPELLAACKAWILVESEMMENHPCPDLALRAAYRKEAVALTKAAITAAEAKP